MATALKFAFRVQMGQFVFAKRAINGKIAANCVVISTSVKMKIFARIIAKTRKEVISVGAHLVTPSNKIATLAKPANDLRFSLRLQTRLCS